MPKTTPNFHRKLKKQCVLAKKTPKADRQQPVAKRSVTTG